MHRGSESQQACDQRVAVVDIERAEPVAWCGSYQLDGMMDCITRRLTVWR